VTRFPRVWAVPDADVASGRIPGYVGAVRIRGEVELHAGGRSAVEAGSPPMREDVLFRLASVTKPIGAALALSLVEDGVLSLDDPIARWLPEAADLRMLVSPDAPLDRTVPAERPVTVRMLLDLTAGWGAVFERTPLQAAMMERGVYPPTPPADMTGDGFVAALCSLPLAFQPGTGWLYDSCLAILGVLLSRAAGQSVPELFGERIARPLGLADTAFQAVDTARLAPAYRPRDGGLELVDPPDGAYAAPPAFPRLNAGLVSSAGDVLRFFTAMADGGAPVLRPGSLAQLTADALNEEQRRQAQPVVGPGGSWGLGTGIDVVASEPWMAPGRWGWSGGAGTTAWVDPVRDTVAVLLTQRQMTGPMDVPKGFWTAVAAAAE
jgi:CubicO group peptidase (beta-lactamase class C family)